MTLRMARKCICEALAFVLRSPPARYRVYKRRAERNAARAAKWLRLCPAWLRNNARATEVIEQARIPHHGKVSSKEIRR